jgi:hypothetical protein
MNRFAWSSGVPLMSRTAKVVGIISTLAFLVGNRVGVATTW